MRGRSAAPSDPSATVWLCWSHERRSADPNGDSAEKAGSVLLAWMHREASQWRERGCRGLDGNGRSAPCGGEIRAPRPTKRRWGVDGEEGCAGAFTASERRIDCHSERAERVEESAPGGGADPSTSRCARRSG